MSAILHYLIHAHKARKHYKALGYTDIPCYKCVIEHEPEDTESPWHWVLCNRCDWGNQ